MSSTDKTKYNDLAVDHSVQTRANVTVTNDADLNASQMVQTGFDVAITDGANNNTLLDSQIGDLGADRFSFV